jgi:hypothetical protein
MYDPNTPPCPHVLDTVHARYRLGDKIGGELTRKAYAFKPEAKLQLCTATKVASAGRTSAQPATSPDIAPEPGAIR